ncbi:hypothetical protein T492DRAFT_1104884, partial [Pavlovales sp. CCMP2436]
VRAGTSPPSDVLHLSGMWRKKSHVGRNSKGSLERRPRDGLVGVASPYKAQGARPSRGRRREPYHRAHRALRVPRETLDRSSVCELATARSPASVHAVRAHREGVLGGGGGSSCLARRTSKVGGLGKVDERQAQVCAHTQGEHDSAKFGAM